MENNKSELIEQVKQMFIETEMVLSENCTNCYHSQLDIKDNKIVFYCNFIQENYNIPKGTYSLVNENLKCKHYYFYIKGYNEKINEMTNDKQGEQ